jgi:hypothetical protein
LSSCCLSWSLVFNRVRVARSLVFNRVRVARSLVFSVVFFRP